MFAALLTARSRFQSSNHHGHFRPWALLHMPDFTRAFRFSYPTLFAAGVNDAFVWDVLRGRLDETITDIQRRDQGATLGAINYVEVNERYAFVCGCHQLRIFTRDGGALLYSISPPMIPTREWIVESPDKSTTRSSTVERWNLRYYVRRASPSTRKFIAGMLVPAYVGNTGS